MKTIYKLSLLLIILTTLFTGCEWLDPETEELAFDDSVNEQVSNYLAEEDSLSLMLELLQLTGYESLLNTYGRSTVFVPSNKAFESYLRDEGKASLNELSEAELLALVEFHIVVKLVDVKAFRTGLLDYSDTTINGLRHFVDVSRGFDNIEINKTSRITKTVELDNGIVYVLDNVLEAHADNIFDYLNSEGNYSIFVEAIESAGLKDQYQNLDLIYSSLVYGEINYTWLYTIFAEPDEVFQKAGISSLDQLKTELVSRMGTSADLALLDFLNYHLLYNYGRMFSFQLYKDENIQTAMQEGKKSIHVAASDILRPDPVFNSSDGGVRLNYKKSDVVFKNGVLHELDGVLFVPQSPTKANLSAECEDFVLYYIPWSLGDVNEYELIGGDFDKGTIGRRYHEEFSSYQVDGNPLALYFEPIDVGGWVEFNFPNVVPGTYDLTLSYWQSKSQVSSNVNIYFRNLEDAFDWKTQLLVKEFDMSDKDDEMLYTDYGQDRLIRTVEIDTYGDYAIRFAHADTKPGIYDVVRLTVSEALVVEE